MTGDCMECHFLAKNDAVPVCSDEESVDTSGPPPWQMLITLLACGVFFNDLRDRRSDFTVVQYRTLLHWSFDPSLRLSFEP